VELLRPLRRYTRLEQQIAVVLGGEVQASKRRGRPPGTGAKPKPAKKKKGKRKMSAEGRARIVEAQRKRWAAVKKGKGKKK
jgi:hypothetical protein